MIGSSSEDIRLRDTIYATDQSVAIHPGATVPHKNCFNFRIAIRKPGSVTIMYAMNARQQKEKEPLMLDIYNSLGKRIFHTALSKHSTRYSWSGTSTTGLPAGTGVFYFKLTYKGTSAILKGVIVR